MYQLLQITSEKGGFVDGVHIEWCCACSLEKATKRARATERANGNRIQVAVADDLYHAYAMGRIYKHQKRLDH